MPNRGASPRSSTGRAGRAAASPGRRLASASGGRLAAPLRAIARLAIAHAGARAGEIGIVLAGDPELRELNRTWRGIDRATDVLSFGYDNEVPRRPSPRGRARVPSRRMAAPGPAAALAPPVVNGDLVISLDRVRVQARRYRASEGRELARLVIHGALHLAGLDHDTAARRAIMRRAERAIMRDAAAHVRALERALAGRPRSIDRRRVAGRHSRA